MKSPEPEELSENIEVVTPGEMLKEARLASRLSIDDIAAKLNLRTALIEAIEANEFDELPSVTFTRGYLRSYAKLMHLSESDVLEAFDYLDNFERQQLEMQSFSNRSSQKAIDNWLAIVSFLVLLAIIALAVLWWWQRNDAQSGLPQAANPQTQVQQKADQTDTDATAKDAAGQEPQAATDVQADNIQAGDEPSDEAQVVDNTTEAEAQTAVADSTTDESALDNATEQSDSDNGSEAQANLSELELHFDENCWINISDATGKRIAIGTKIKGHVTKVMGVAPFTIKLGKPDGVTILLDGEEKKIPYYPKGSVANFVLSKD